MATLIAVMAAGSSTFASARVGSAAAGAPPCEPKITKIDGHRAVVNCGPATMTVRLHGHTYTFHDGFCLLSRGVFELSLGTTVPGLRGNAGKPDVTIEVLKSGTASLYGPDYGGKQLLSDTLIHASNSGRATGTFKSAMPSVSVSGSWNCHGVIFKP